MPSIIPPTSTRSTRKVTSSNSFISPKVEQQNNQGILPVGVDSETELHAFRPPNGATRSPCPALNSLANHSYLPHNGRNITFSALVSGLQAGFGLSRGFALFMAIGTFTLLRRPSLAPFDLHGTARHNFIEHNASMVHDDASPGAEYAPTDVDLQLLHKFLAKAHPSETGNSDSMVIVMHDIVDARIEREAASAPVDALHAELGRAEFAMVMEILGKGGEKELNRDELDVFLRENRLPEGWAPICTLHLWEAAARSRKIRVAMEKVRAAGVAEKADKRSGGAWGWVKLTVEQLLSHS